MTPDLEQLREWFNLFNARYFDGALPDPTLMLNNTRTVLGQFTYRKASIALFGLHSAEDYCIAISQYYDATEKELQTTLLHEMIHFKLCVEHKRDTSPHGKLFRKEMERINAQGWNITVRANTKGWALNGGKRTPPRLVVAASNGKEHLFAAVQRHYAKTFDEALGRISGFERRKWYLTSDEYFRPFPVVRSLRVHKVSEEEFNNVCQRLESSGESIEPQRL